MPNNSAVYYDTPKGAFIKGLKRTLPEAALLFFVLFFPQSAVDLLGPESIIHSLFWRVPALLLVLLLLDKSVEFRPKRDCAVFCVTFPALFAASFLVSLAAGLSGFAAPEAPSPPAGLSGWTAAVLFSLSVGFLEEAFFRLYLPHRLLGQMKEQSSRSAAAAFAASAVLFAFCHAWEGPWGIVNALAAALALSFAYVKSGSFFGIALAHGFYNVLVFVLAHSTSVYP